MKKFKRVLRSTVCFLVIFAMMSSMVFAINVNEFEVVSFTGGEPYRIIQGDSAVVRVMFDGRGNANDPYLNIDLPTGLTLTPEGVISSESIQTKEFTGNNENLFFDISLEIAPNVAPGEHTIDLRNVDGFSKGENVNFHNNLITTVTFTVVEQQVQTLTVTATADNKTYNGNTEASVTLQYDVGDDDITVNYTEAYFETRNAGNDLLVTIEGLSLTGNDADKYELESTTITTTASISKANANIKVEDTTVTYNGNPHGATGTATGVNNDDLSGLLQLGESFTDAGDYTAEWVFEGNQNYNAASGSADIVIEQADALIDVPDVTVRYDGNPHKLSGTATGAADEDLSSLLDLGGTYTEAAVRDIDWIFEGDDNHLAASGKAKLTITEADLLVTAVSDDTKVYDGQAFDNFGVTYDGFINGEDASVLDEKLEWTITDADGEIVEEAINAGTYTITPSGLTSNNYDIAFARAEITIQKADADISVEGKTVTYDGTSHGASGTATGINEEDLSEWLDLEDTVTDAPGGEVEWNFSGHPNYNDVSGIVEILINQAKADITVSNITVEYDGTHHELDGTAFGVNGEDLSDLLEFEGSFIDVPGGTGTWSFPETTNYLQASGEATVTITKADLIVAAVDDSKVYDGDVFSGFDVTYDGFKGVDNESVLEGDIQWEILDADGEIVEEAVNAGTYTIIPSGLESDNYKIAYEGAEITIAKADAVISVEGKTLTYDGEEHGAAGEATGVKGEDLSGLLSLGDKFTNVPGGTAKWTFEGNENYYEASGSVKIDIHKADALINVPDVNVDYTGTPHKATGTAIGVNEEDLSEFMDFGESFINAPGGTTEWTFEGSDNYNDAAGKVTIQINRVNADITVSDVNIGYDGTYHGLEGSAFGVQGEDLSDLLDLGDRFRNVPGETTQWTFEGDTNYLPASGYAHINITEADLVVAAINDGKVYDGTAFESFDVTITGFKGDDDASDLSGELEWEILDADGNVVESAVNAGTYTITPSGLENSNYDIDFVPAEIIIDPRPITIAATDNQKVYGESDPELGYEITEGDLASGDDFTGSISRELGQSVGNYEIRRGTLAINDVYDNDNYDLTFIKGNFTITPRSISITAVDAEKVYGENDPALTYEVTEGSLAFNDALTGELTRVEGEDVGTYDISRGPLSINDVYDNPNYNVTFNEGVFTITVRPITVTADDKSKIYGEDDPDLSYQITDGSLAFDDDFTGGIDRVEGEDVGTYTILQDTLELSDNYDLTFVDGEFEITKRAVTVTADNQSKIYGEDDPAFTYTITEGELMFEDTFSGKLSRETGEDVGTYDIIQDTLELSGNYDLTFVDGELEITQRPITVTADNINKIYGADDPELTYQITEGSVAFEGDEFQGQLTRGVGEDVGDYIINQGNLTLGNNYNISFEEGTFSIRYSIQGLFPPGSDDEIICFKTGRAIPLKWAYVDADGNVVDSSDFLLQVHFRKADTDDDSEEITTPGNHSLSYHQNSDSWHVNWHTRGMDSGLYELIIFDEATGQMDIFYIHLE